LYSDDQIKKNEMGGARSTYGKRRHPYRALEGSLRGIEHVEYPGVDERIILK
jgi:hypothetical protein